MVSASSSFACCSAAPLKGPSTGTVGGSSDVVPLVSAWASGSARPDMDFAGWLWLWCRQGVLSPVCVCVLLACFYLLAWQAYCSASHTHPTYVLFS